jgi:hypothetical protein
MTIAIILLALATAAVHISFYIVDPAGGFIYGLNALGYVGLVAALYLPIPFLDHFRPVVRRALMGYAALTFAAYVALGLVQHEWTVPLGPLDQLAELTLIAVLWRDDQHPLTRSFDG